MVERILFIVNRSSAMGYGDAAIHRLRSVLCDAMGDGMKLQVEAVDSHQEAKAQTKAFLNASDAPALIVAGGGGGTLRAVIEGICEGSEPGDLPGRERVRISSLRMGSGNVVAKEFGIPRDPEAAIRGITSNLRRDRTTTCCIMRYEIGRKDFPPEVCYATTLGGFGQFGRSPKDLERWHRRFPRLRKLMAGWLGIERFTNVEYGLSLLIRSVWCALWPVAAEVVEVRTGKRTESMRLLAGAVMNFPLKVLPFDPGVHAEEPSLSLNFVPYQGWLSSLLLVLRPGRLVRKALQIQIEGSDLVEVHLADRDRSDFFLDEDPMVFEGKVSIQVAGTLAFVPGPDYRWPQNRG